MWHFFIISSTLCVLAVRGSDRPNIVFILADDLGWDDVGFHGSDQIPTPNIDTLAYDGIILNNYYVQPICTPSRSALMTGRHPIHLGMQHSVLVEAEPVGLGLDQTLLPQYLKSLGYATHIVGKWHLGYFDPAYVPTRRGFDTHFGYYQGCGDYWDHTYTNGESGRKQWGLDFWLNEMANRTCYGQYSTELFTQRTEDIIANHDTNKPLFLYLPHQAVHSGNMVTPLEAPWKYLKHLGHIKQPERRAFAGMASALDDSIGHVTRALAARGMLNNTIIAFSTDNGGPAAGYDWNMACNWPLRGVKNTLWEGGVRGAGFLWSPLLKQSGYVSQHMMQIFDWLPTLLSAAGYDMNELPRDLDGIDQWRVLSNDERGVRTEMLLNIDPNRRREEPPYFALTVHNMKVISGRMDMSGWYKPGQKSREYNVTAAVTHFPPPAAGVTRMDQSQVHEPDWLYESSLTSTLANLGRTVPSPHPVVVNCGEKPANMSNCDPNKEPCLFDISKDPCEFHNLASKHPDILATLLDRVEMYRKNMVKPRNKPNDPRGFPIYHKGVWAPWVNITGIMS